MMMQEIMYVAARDGITTGSMTLTSSVDPPASSALDTETVELKASVVTTPPVYGEAPP